MSDNPFAGALESTSWTHAVIIVCICLVAELAYIWKRLTGNYPDWMRTENENKEDGNDE